MFNMEKILIGGAGGFIGSNLVRFLKEKGYWIRAVDIHFPKEREYNWRHADEIIKADLRDMDEVLAATKGVDKVIWLCSNMGGVFWFHTQDFYPFLDNMTMDINILRACEVNKVKRLLYSSSACIYPIHLQQDQGLAPYLSEDIIFPANSDQMYGWEKLMMTMLCKRAPFDARPMIFHTIYGEYQEHEGERMKFPTSIVRKVLQSKKDGLPIEIWGNGKQVRSYLYIKDALEKIYRVLIHPENVTPINIASDEAVSCLDVAKLVCDIVGVEPNFTFTDAKPSGVLARNADNTLFEKTYGYKNKYSLRDGFTALVNYMKDKV
jgi:nucleoside-diphosphate-sugar epimerase